MKKVNMMKRIAMIGVGPMASLHVKAIQQIKELKITHCTSRSQEKAEKFANEHGIDNPQTLDDFKNNPDVDALWVVAPADKMSELALELNKLGKPMFLEKPVGLSVEETRNVAQQLTVPNMIGLNRRFYEIIQRSKKIIDQAGGARAIEVHMPENIRLVPDKQSQYSKEQWQFANSVHLLDLFRFFGGEVKNITSQNTVKNIWNRSYNALLEFVNGANGIYNAQWYAPAGWRVTVYAEDVSVTLAPIEKATVMRQGEKPYTIDAQKLDREFKPGLCGQAECFLSLLETGEKPQDMADIHDYLKSVELVDQLTQASSQQEELAKAS